MLPPDNSPPTNPPPNNNNPGQKLLGVLESQLLEIGWPCSPLAVRPRLFVTASITGYVAVITLVIPASIAVKHASFSSQNTCGRIKEVHPASIAIGIALFSPKNTCRRER